MFLLCSGTKQQANLSLCNSTLMLLLFRVLKERKERKEVWNNEEEAEVGCKGLCKRGGEGKGVKSTDIVTVAISNVRSHNNWFAVAKLEEASCWLE